MEMFGKQIEGVEDLTEYLSQTFWIFMEISFILLTNKLTDNFYIIIYLTRLLSFVTPKNLWQY